MQHRDGIWRLRLEDTIAVRAGPNSRLDPHGPQRHTPAVTNQSHIVTEDEADIRLDRWSAGTPRPQQSLIQKWCRTGEIRVDGQVPEPARG